MHPGPLGAIDQGGISLRQADIQVRLPKDGTTDGIDALE